MATELLGVAKDATQLELSRAFQVKGLEALRGGGRTGGGLKPSVTRQ